MTTIPSDIVALDGVIDQAIWPQLQNDQAAHFQANGNYFGAVDLSAVTGYENLEPGVYSVIAYTTEEELKGFILIVRKTSSNPTLVSEPYVPNWDTQLPPDQQQVEYRDVEYYDWERIDDITQNYRGKYWTYGNFES